MTTPNPRFRIYRRRQSSLHRSPGGPADAAPDTKTRPSERPARDSIVGPAYRGPKRRRLAWQLLPGLALLLAAVGVWTWLQPKPSERFDIAIVGGTILDGTGGPPFFGGLGIRGDRIASVWRGERRVSAEHLLEATGLAVAPGFIDTHSHADGSLQADGAGLAESWSVLLQGVTTLIVGNCGRSFVRMEDLTQQFLASRPHVNFATLVGHNSLRREVMKERLDPPTLAEQGEMERLLEQAITAGAVGLSTGLEYRPGRFAQPAEIVGLMHVAARMGTLHASHLRDEGLDGTAALREVLNLSREADLPLVVSHFKISGRNRCGELGERLSLLAAAREAGQTVYMDFYPYAASSSSLDLILPDWFVRGSSTERRTWLREPPGRERLLDELRAIPAQQGWDDFGFARVAWVAGKPGWSGRLIPELAETERGAPGLEQQVRVLEELLRSGGAQMVYHDLCPNALEAAALDPMAMVGSDSALRSRGSEYNPHPRGCGTMPRFFRQWTRMRGKVAPQEAVRRMSYLPASLFGLKDRGVLAPGAYADVVAFDPLNFADRATYSRPLLEPVGVAWVLVNGRPAVEYGRVLEQRAGRLLRRANSASPPPS